MDKTKVVSSLNKLIATAIEHGGDAGGAYHSCPHKVMDAAYQVLLDLELNSQYEVWHEIDGTIHIKQSA